MLAYAMILSSSDFRFVVSSLVVNLAAKIHSKGRFVLVSEEDYSEINVPFFGATSVITALLQSDDKIENPFLTEVNSWDGQGLQPH